MENDSRKEERTPSNDDNANPLLHDKPTDGLKSQSDDVIDVDYMCGIGSWRPQRLQIFTKFNATFCILLFSMVSTTLTFAAFSAAVASWERRYGFSSTFLGVTFTTPNIAVIVTLPFITYFGGQPTSHRPRWIGVGILFAAFGIFLIGSVQFMSDLYDTGSAFRPTDNSSVVTTGLCSPSGYDVLQTSGLSNASTMVGCDGTEQTPNKASTIIIVIIMTGLIMFGAGTASLFSLAVSYIDDNVPTKKSPMYMGILYSMFGFGPLIGFPIASYCNSMYVDFYRVDMTTIGITQYDPRWIGAWWLPYLMNAAILCIAAIPLILLPKKFKVPGNDHAVIPSKTKETSMSQKWKAFPIALKRLLSNARFMSVTFAYCADCAVIGALAPYFTKYIKDQFRTSIAIAAIATPAAFILPSGIGMLLGGLLLRKYKPTLPTIAKFVTINSFVMTICTVPMMFIGCNNYDFAGVNVQYSSTGGYVEDMLVNRDAPCNSDCHCSPTRFNPVCGSDGITYFSSCHAGCKDAVSNSEPGTWPILTNLTECSCVSMQNQHHTIAEVKVDLEPSISPRERDGPITMGPGVFDVSTNVSMLSTNATMEMLSNVTLSSGNENIDVGQPLDVPYVVSGTQEGYAMTGICGKECSNQLILFLVFFFFMSLVSALTTTFVVELTLRAVSPADKPLAFGIRSLFSECLAWLPTAIYIGAVFDSTCQLWGETPCGERGACWVYDLKAYRMKFVAVLIAIKLISSIFYMLNLLLLRKQKGEQAKDSDYKHVPNSSTPEDEVQSTKA